LLFSFASSPACGITSDLAAVVCSLVEWLVVSPRGLRRGYRERVGVRETGIAWFIIMGDIVAMPVRMCEYHKQEGKYHEN